MGTMVGLGVFLVLGVLVLGIIGFIGFIVYKQIKQYRRFVVDLLRKVIK